MTQDDFSSSIDHGLDISGRGSDAHVPMKVNLTEEQEAANRASIEEMIASRPGLRRAHAGYGGAEYLDLNEADSCQF